MNCWRRVWSPIRLVLLSVVLLMGAGRPLGTTAAPAPRESDFHYVSRFCAYRWQEGKLQGKDRLTGRWRDVPRRRKGERWRPEDLRSVMPVKVDGPSVPPARGNTMFSESFEVDDCPHCPLEPTFGPTATWDSWDDSYLPGMDDPETIWGITCERSHTGQSSAWCSKWERQCVPGDCADTAWHCIDSEQGLMARPQSEPSLELNNVFHWPDQATVTLTYWAWQGFDPNNSESMFNDFLEVLVVDPDSYTDYLLEVVIEPMESWSEHQCLIPYPNGGWMDGFMIGFYYDIFSNTSGNAGVFIDDVTISSQDMGVYL